MKSTRRMGFAWLAAALLAAGGCGGRDDAPRTAAVERGDIRMEVPFQGELDARRVERIAVGLQGSAVLADIVEEGARVQAGDVLARFDATQVRQDLARQEGELTRAEQEMASLEQAELPLELMDLESKLADVQADRAAEERFLESVRNLAGRDLMATGEVSRQEAKVEAQRVREEQLRKRIGLTRDHLHTARLAKARAAREAARQQRDFTARQLELCEVRAPAAGIATRVPLPVGGDYRTVHVGDTLFHNQVFMCLPDAGEHIVRGTIGEAELPWVKPGAPVIARAPAFPDLELTGQVEQVGAMAQTRPGQPVWRKFFPVRIALEPLPAEMPVGITVQADILAGEARGVLRLPREAVTWRDSRAVVRRPNGGGEEIPVETGLADATHIEIRSGLAEGDRVLLP